MYLANVRWQEWLYGDLMAQLGSIWTGKRRLIELAAHYGNDEVERYIEAIFDYADQRMAQEIRQMPDGDYEGTSWLDTDGQGGTDIPVNARVSIRDDRVHIDFGGSAPQTPGANNLSFGVMQAAAGIPILCTIDPSIPHNDGCLRHITAEAPLGSVCNAQYPASTALATIGPDDTMQDAVYKALATRCPSASPAATAGSAACPSSRAPIPATGRIAPGAACSSTAGRRAGPLRRRTAGRSSSLPRVWAGSRS